nr:ATP-binding protein [Clostridiales bacterium]
VAAAAFSAEHIASMLDSIIALFAPETLQYTDTGLLNLPVLLNYTLCRIVVFSLVDLLIIRKNHDVDDNSIRSVPSLLILIISLIVNLYMNIVFSGLASDRSFWVSMFNFAMNAAISLLLLLCQYAMVREGRMRMQLQISDLLRAQAREQYRISRENVEAINMKCHDLKHLLLAVRDVIDPTEYSSMMDMINSYGSEIKTNNEVLDVVFQEKNFRCRKLGIQFTCIIDGTAVNFMGTTDLYVLFGNLLDNAIEAVAKLPPESVKNIQVTVRREKGFVVVTTENGYIGDLDWQEGRLHTSKADKASHGFGILSVERIVKKYGGRYSISTEDQIFCMNIVFPMQ